MNGWWVGLPTSFYRKSCCIKDTWCLNIIKIWGPGLRRIGGWSVEGRKCGKKWKTHIIRLALNATCCNTAGRWLMGGFLWNHVWSETNTVERNNNTEFLEKENVGERKPDIVRALLRWSYMVQFPGGQIWFWLALILHGDALKGLFWCMCSVHWDTCWNH